MTRTQTFINGAIRELLLLSLYLVILKAAGWLTRGWLFALLPLLIVAVTKLAAFVLLVIGYIIDKYRHGKR
jgi:hypothetical protein